MAHGDGDIDPAFALLPSALRKRIDDALDAAIDGAHDGSLPARKRRKVDPEAGPGGFVVDNVPAPGGFFPDTPAGGFLVDEPQGGGFVRDSSPQVAEGSLDGDSEGHREIPLLLIPTALQLLDLPPDDEDVLAVFRNAASGWGGRAQDGHTSEAADDGGAFVSRKDWRAVCAALLDTGREEEDAEMDEGGASGEEEAEGGSDSAEEYVESGGDSGSEFDEEDSDEYVESGARASGQRQAGGTKGKKSASTKGRGRGRRSTTSSSDGEARLSERQRRECRATFRLFFPDVEDRELDKRRIGIKDITRVAGLLKEKISAEEVSNFAQGLLAGGALTVMSFGRGRRWRCSLRSRPVLTGAWA